MRKAIFALILVAILAIPAMAEVTVLGYLDYGFIMNGTEVSTRTYNRLDINAKVDDFNNTWFRLEQTTAAKDTAGAVRVRYAYVKTNVSGILALPEVLAVSTVLGWVDTYDQSYVNTVTRHIVDVGNVGIGIGYNMGVEITLAKLVTIVAYADPLEDNDLYIGARMTQKIGEFPLSFEAYFAGNKAATLGAGNIVIGGEFKPAFGDVALDIGLGFRLSLATGNAWVYGFGIGATMSKIINFRVNLNGDNTNILDWITIEANLGKFADLLTFRLAGYLRLSATDIFRGFDGCVDVALKALTLRVGYLYNPTYGGTASNVHTFMSQSIAAGGFYVRGMITWK